MNLPRKFALTCYYEATRFHRRRHLQSLSAANRAPVSVLFYHRVADVHPNQWTLSTRDFIRQLEWIRKHFAILSLHDAQQQIEKGGTRPAVCITFDDGYAENCETALPYLLREEIPFTYFVASRHVMDDMPFPHDVEHGTLLRPNTPEQIRSLATAGVEIGAHTRYHTDLGPIEDEQLLHEEIAGSKEDLEELTNQPVRYFAFPYGQPENLSTRAFAIAHRCGLSGVCSAYGGYNVVGGDPFHVVRIHGDPELIRVKNWLTLDPRKQAAARDFEPDDYRVYRPVPTDDGQHSPCLAHADATR